MSVFASALIGLLFFSGVAAAEGGPSTPPSLPVPPGFSATLTGYNAVPGQTDDTPDITADGGPANPAVVAARSRDLGDELPFGTIIELNAPVATSTTCGYTSVGSSIGYRVITDTMNARYTDRVDVLFPNQDEYLLESGKTINASTLLGVCAGVTVRVVGHIDLAHTSLPATQAALAQMVNSAAVATLAVE